MNAAGGGVGQNRPRLAEVGVGYGVGDRAALERQARERAIADARAKAEQRAELLRVPLGRLLLSDDVAPAANDGAAPMVGRSTRSAADTAPPYQPVGGVTLAPYEPTDPAEAIVRVRIGLSFAVAEQE